MLPLPTHPKFQRASAPLPSCLVLGHEDQCVDKHLDLQRCFFSTWTRFNLGKVARVAFRGHVEHVTSDFWHSMYSCCFVGWGPHKRLCSWSLTQRSSFFFGLDPRKTSLTVLCTLQPKHREGHDFLVLRGISISTLKLAEKNDEGWEVLLHFWQVFKLVCINIIEGLRRTYPNIGRQPSVGDGLDASSGHLKHFNLKGFRADSPSQIDVFYPWWKDADAGNGTANMQGALTSLSHLL